MKSNTETTPARSTFECIAEMVETLRRRNDSAHVHPHGHIVAIDQERIDAARQAIEESPLSLRVRSGWVNVGEESQFEPEEFEILMSTGGPAVRILGTLDEYREPDTARIEWQDWFKPWTDEGLTSDESNTLLEFCRVFYFGE